MAPPDSGQPGPGGDDQTQVGRRRCVRALQRRLLSAAGSEGGDSGG